jgi:hypothetical protein
MLACAKEFGGNSGGNPQVCADGGANLRKGILEEPTMPIDQCKQQLEHAAQFATLPDLRSEVQKQLAPLDGARRTALTAWASDELKRLTQPGEAASKVVYLHELEKLTRRIAMLQAVLGQSEEQAA